MTQPARGSTYADKCTNCVKKSMHPEMGGPDFVFGRPCRRSPSSGWLCSSQKRETSSQNPGPTTHTQQTKLQQITKIIPLNIHYSKTTFPRATRRNLVQLRTTINADKHSTPGCDLTVFRSPAVIVNFGGLLEGNGLPPGEWK